MTNQRKEIRDWLRAELQRAGHGAKRKLADFLGVRPDAVTRMLNDEPGKEPREVKAEELVKMGLFFKSTPPGVMRPDEAEQFHTISTQPIYVNILGKVAANTWLDVEDMDFDYEDITPVPVLSSYPGAWQFGLVVDGNCLNKVANNGDILICLDIIAKPEEINENDLVIVERKKYGGQMVQRTAKRVRRTANGYELWPESTDPQHQDPIILNEVHDGEEVTVIGKVLWVMRKP